MIHAHQLIVAALLTEEGDDSKTPSLGCILSCSDSRGLAPHCITFITSNLPDILDPALLRAGRYDVHALFPAMGNRDQMAGMVRRLYPAATSEEILALVDAHVVGSGLSHAAFEEILGAARLQRDENDDTLPTDALATALIRAKQEKQQLK